MLSEGAQRRVHVLGHQGRCSPRCATCWPCMLAPSRWLSAIGECSSTGTSPMRAGAHLQQSWAAGEWVAACGPAPALPSGAKYFHSLLRTHLLAQCKGPVDVMCQVLAHISRSLLADLQQPARLQHRLCEQALAALHSKHSLVAPPGAASFVFPFAKPLPAPVHACECASACSERARLASASWTSSPHDSVSMSL